MSPAAALALGFMLGLRHATDADHVVAVSAVASREKSAWGAVRIGAFWGLGHTLTILIAGGLVIVLGLMIPARVALGLEMGVAAMLIALGATNLRAAGHTHDAQSVPVRGRSPWRPFAVGVVHGLAGTAALTLLVLTTLRDRLMAMLYLGVFGLGTIVGMTLLSAALAWPVSMAARRAVSFERLLTRATGLVSVALGLFLVYRIGFVEGLLRSSAL